MSLCKPFSKIVRKLTNRGFAKAPHLTPVVVTEATLALVLTNSLEDGNGTKETTNLCIPQYTVIVPWYFFERASELLCVCVRMCVCV